jgi:hypothetical protein
MKWLLAGLLFALAIALAIGTAALRADNVRMRHRVELAIQAAEDRIVEFTRLSVERLAEATPERLAKAHWAQLRAEQRRLEAQEP